MNPVVARAILVLTSIVLTTFVAWFAVAGSNGSHVFSPAPLATLVPAIYLGQGLAVFAVTVRELHLIPCVGLTYSILLFGHLLRGKERIPKLSVWLFTFLAAADILFLVWAFPFGVQYQGVAYTVALLVLNALFILSGLFLLTRNRNCPSFRTNYFFHSSVALLLCWFSFPWLGEMP